MIYLLLWGKQKLWLVVETVIVIWRFAELLIASRTKGKVIVQMRLYIILIQVLLHFQVAKL